MLWCSDDCSSIIMNAVINAGVRKFYLTATLSVQARAASFNKISLYYWLWSMAWCFDHRIDGERGAQPCVQFLWSVASSMMRTGRRSRIVNAAESMFRSERSLMKGCLGAWASREDRINGHQNGDWFTGAYPAAPDPCFDLNVVRSCHQPHSRNDVIRVTWERLVHFTNLELATVLLDLFDLNYLITCATLEDPIIHLLGDESRSGHIVTWARYDHSGLRIDGSLCFLSKPLSDLSFAAAKCGVQFYLL